MKVNKTIAIAVLLFGLLAGSLGAGVFLTQRPASVNAAPAGQQAATCTDDDDVQHEADGEADDANEDAACDENETNEPEKANGADEVDEADALQGQTGITAEEAQAAVEAANPGVKALAVELDNENGTVIYEVELNNGTDVKVDAANGAILGSDGRDAN